MELEKAVGRLIMPAVRAEDPTSWPVAEELAREPADGGIGAGGFLVFGGDAETLPSRLGAVRRAAGGRKLFHSADFERGAGQQVAGLTRLPHLMAIGATGSEDLARRAGFVTGREARSAGIQLVFAPDVDLNTDPRNPIINIRAFGDDPHAVTKLAAAWISGCRAGGALTCIKHFPGHGHTAVDSHVALPRLDAGMDVLEGRELAPFGALASGPGAADSIMTAHMAVPALTGERDTPVTLSPRAIEFMRKAMGFKGLIVTDALLMGGITAAFDEAEAGVLALAAGCDLLLCPADPARLHRTVVEAVRSGRVPEARVHESLARLEAAISRVEAPGGPEGQNARGGPANDSYAAAARAPEAEGLAEEIAARALTRIRGPVPAAPAQVVVIVSGDAGEAGGPLVVEVHRRAPGTRLLPVSTDSPDARLATVAAEVAAAARRGERIAVVLLSKVLAWKGGSGLPEREARLVEDLCERAPAAAVVSCGSPYLLEHARLAAFTACAFSDEPPSQRAGAAALLGAADWPGTSPVALAAALRQ